MEWRHSDSPRPKYFRVQNSPGKVLASIFWDQDGILPIDYFPKGQSIKAGYYLTLLVQLKVTLEERHWGKVTKVVLFVHENVPDHRAFATQKKLTYLCFQFLDHPPYSLHLAPSDYHLFPGLKKQLKVTIYPPTRRSLGPRRPDWTDNIPNFLKGLQKLQKLAKKCIELRGENVEKIPSLVAVACFLSGRAKNLSAPPR